MQLIISASTVEELMEKVCAIANKFNVDLSQNTKTPVTKEIVEAAKTIEVEAEVEEKPAPKAKKAKKETVVEAPVELVAHETKEFVTYTKQDIANACQKVSEKHGLEVAREILATFGAKRISEVKEEEYAAFVKACEGSL